LTATITHGEVRLEFRWPADAERVAVAEFEFVAYDCRELVAKNYIKGPMPFFVEP
jgi:hypothetical protein